MSKNNIKEHLEVMISRRLGVISRFSLETIVNKQIKKINYQQGEMITSNIDIYTEIIKLCHALAKKHNIKLFVKI